MSFANKQQHLGSFRPGVRVLLSEGELKSRIAELAAALNHEYRNRDLVLLAVLKGAFIFVGELARRLTVPVQLDFVQIQAVVPGTGPEPFTFQLSPGLTLAGRDVLVVADVLSAGHDLQWLTAKLHALRVKSVQCCVLLDQPSKHETELVVEYVGFEVPDEALVGFGLAAGEDFRELPYVGFLHPRPGSAAATNGNS